MAAIVENQDGIDISTIVGITREALANNPPFLRRAQSLFLRIDINSDGLLTKNELEALVGTDKADFMMNDLDVDHNNQVDPAEWNTYWVKCKSGRFFFFFWIIFGLYFISLYRSISINLYIITKYYIIISYFFLFFFLLYLSKYTRSWHKC